ncbi:MAG: hypothetical protein AAB538_05150 [Patescibacteria group bacterium]
MNKGAFYAGIIVLVLIVGGGMYAYVQRPARAVSNAVQKLGQAETQHFDATVTLDNPAATQPLLQGAGTLTARLNGSYDRRGEQRDTLVTELTINTQTEGVTIELAGELRFIDDHAYLFVKKSPTAIPLLIKLKDQWVELPRGRAQEARAQSDEGPLFMSVKRVGREQVDGRGTVKYETVATQRVVVAFMDRIAQLLGTQLTDQQVGTIRQNLAGVEELPVTLWVTPLRHELVQLETRLGDGGTRYTIKFSERNELVDHTAPEGARPIQEVLQQ